MTGGKKVRVAIVGLGFGAEFIPLYQNHPNAEMSGHLPAYPAETRRNWRRLRRQKTLHEIPKTCWPIPILMPVHINTPIPDHARQSIAALKAGKHVACTVPMGTSVDECRQIVEAQDEWQELHDDGNRGVQPRIPICERDV